jgi:hypothetical protein
VHDGSGTRQEACGARTLTRGDPATAPGPAAPSSVGGGPSVNCRGEERGEEEGPRSLCRRHHVIEVVGVSQTVRVVP